LFIICLSLSNNNVPFFGGQRATKLKWCAADLLDSWGIGGIRALVSGLWRLGFNSQGGLQLGQLFLFPATT